jgi:hypothetical protein
MMNGSEPRSDVELADKLIDQAEGQAHLMLLSVDHHRGGVAGQGTNERRLADAGRAGDEQQPRCPRYCLFEHVFCCARARAPVRPVGAPFLRNVQLARTA